MFCLSVFWKGASALTHLTEAVLIGLLCHAPGGTVSNVLMSEQ